MTANIAPIFTDTPVLAMASTSGSNPNLDGTGSLVDVVTGDADGTRITRITVTTTGSCAAGMVRLFLNDTVNTKLWKEIPVTATTPSATAPAFTSILEFLAERAILLPSGYVIKASTSTINNFNIIVEGSHY